MKGYTASYLLIVCVLNNGNIFALNLPGPMVYVVTPSSRPVHVNNGKSAPFYYHNWIRRMDSDTNYTTTLTPAPPTTTSKVKTPDLIFAEFESDSKGSLKKSIRKLLEKEQVEEKEPTTFRPIHIVDEDFKPVSKASDFGLPISNVKEEDKSDKKNDYFEMYNKLYNDSPAPIYVSPTTTSTTAITTAKKVQPMSNNVENIWHIIDSEKYNQYEGNWEEIPVRVNSVKDNKSTTESNLNEPTTTESNNEEDNLYKNLALPGFTNPGNGAENESRAIRTEPNLRFPYVQLKPFQMKTLKNPLQNLFTNSKKGNNLFTNLDNFYDLKSPVRGEAQDVIPASQPIDRYNPAQPYLPQQNYGGNSKQSNVISTPEKTTANLVPPPPPPPPKLTDNDFPTPTNYESFPPYPPSIRNSALPPQPVQKPIPVYSPPAPTDDSSNDDSISSDENHNGPPMDLGYHYRPPSGPVQAFVPTLPPLMKPFEGYKKPSAASEAPPVIDMNDNPNFQGYHYDKPEAQPPPYDHMSPPNYHLHDSPPIQHDAVYPELIFQKHHGDDSKDMDDKKPELHSLIMDDTGFPSDLPGDIKYHHEFDDHDFYHHHHDTTTTSTTEMPRVNRFSYYYLGKKLYYLPLYFSVYFIIYVGALIIKAVLRHKIVYPNSWRPNQTTSTFFSKRAIESWDLSNENLHEITGKVTHAIATAANKYTEHSKRLNNVVLYNSIILYIKLIC